MQRWLLIVAILTATLAFAGCDKGDHATPPVRELPKPTSPPHLPTTPPTPAAPATQAAAVDLAAPTNVKCPVSGDDVDPKDPKAPVVTYNGKSYALCCKDCIKDFNANPAKYVKAE